MHSWQTRPHTPAVATRWLAPGWRVLLLDHCSSGGLRAVGQKNRGYSGAFLVATLATSAVLGGWSAGTTALHLTLDAFLPISFSA